jgi:hypothetical protein
MKRAIPSRLMNAASPTSGMNCAGSWGWLKLVELMELKIVLSNLRTSGKSAGRGPDASIEHGHAGPSARTFFFPRVLGPQEYEGEGGCQGDEADP